MSGSYYDSDHRDGNLVNAVRLERAASALSHLLLYTGNIVPEKFISSPSPSLRRAFRRLAIQADFPSAPYPTPPSPDAPRRFRRRRRCRRRLRFRYLPLRLAGVGCDFLSHLIPLPHLLYVLLAACLTRYWIGNLPADGVPLWERGAGPSKRGFSFPDLSGEDMVVVEGGETVAVVMERRRKSCCCCCCCCCCH